jgi:2-hydroxychromene-2-carboxylate isomerase
LLHPTRGTESAPVRIELYGDLTCAITRRSYQRVMALRLEHPDDVTVVWKPYWDPQRESAPLAAEVARALFEREGQQAFWAFFDRLLITTRRITSDLLLSAADDAGADMHAFRRALRTRVHKNSLQRCLEEAEAIGVDTSPTLVINDVMLVGEPSEDRLHWAYVDAKSALESRRRVEMGATHAELEHIMPPMAARGLLIRYRGARNAPGGLSRTREQARERATKLIGRARMEGADFADVALRFADSLLEPEELSPRLIDPVLADAVATLKLGELSAPVECDEGFLVAQRVG